MRRALWLLAAACTVDLGPTPDGGACAPSPEFFVSDVYPRYLAANQCGTRACHDFSDGHGTLRLRPPGSAPAPGTPLAAWPLDWRENYLSTLQQLNCDSPLASRLLTMPEGVNDLHPPGPIVLDRQTAAEVIQAWVAAP
jgi:hypothetical protein